MFFELGCGPGTLWAKNQDSIPESWDIVLSDVSPGMLDAARENLAGMGHPFAYRQWDAQAIPLADASIDGVIANHMLYHVPDRARAFAEIRRVLKPEGRFYAATNGRDHLRELGEFDACIGIAGALDAISETFNLENGTEQLTPWFAHVSVRRYEDALHVTEAEPLVAYILSQPGAGAIGEAQRTALKKLVESKLARAGAIHVTKSTGLFIAAQQCFARDSGLGPAADQRPVAANGARPLRLLLRIGARRAFP